MRLLTKARVLGVGYTPLGKSGKWRPALRFVAVIVMYEHNLNRENSDPADAVCIGARPFERWSHSAAAGRVMLMLFFHAYSAVITGHVSATPPKFSCRAIPL